VPGFACIILLGRRTILSGKEVPGLAYIILLGLTILSGKDVPEFTCIIFLRLTSYYTIGGLQ
jgi:hypothetical protein